MFSCSCFVTPNVTPHPTHHPNWLCNLFLLLILPFFLRHKKLKIIWRYFQIPIQWTHDYIWWNHQISRKQRQEDEKSYFKSLGMSFAIYSFPLISTHIYTYTQPLLLTSGWTSEFWLRFRWSSTIYTDYCCIIHIKSYA